MPGTTPAERTALPFLPLPLAAVLVIAVTAGALALAFRTPVGLEIEQAFPLEHPDRIAYERYRAAFPGEEARAAVVVRAADALTPGGVARLAALEADLRAIPGVEATLSPASLRWVLAGPFGPAARPLLRPGLSPAQWDARLVSAARDPLVGWTLFRPDRGAAFVLVSLGPGAAGSAAGRDRFTLAARAVLDRHARSGQSLLLTGMPVMRARLAGLVRQDLARIVPAALLSVVLLVLLAFASARAGLAALAAAGASLAWTFGALGASGLSLGFALGLLPVLVVIVSVGDAVHLLAAHGRLRREGLARRAAAAAALREVAGTCLVTELVLAAGFLSLVLVNVRAIADLGLAAAAAMPVTWAATMAVASLVLAAGGGGPEPGPARPPSLAVRLAGRLVTACARLSLRRPGRVAAVSAALVAASLALGLRVERIDFILDDIPPGSPLGAEVREVEEAYGGYVPIALHLEAVEDGASPLDPAALRLADEAAAFLRTLPAVTAVASGADLVRRLHRVAAGDAAGPDGLPASRGDAAAALDHLDDPRATAPFLSADRRSLAVVARVPDLGSRRAAGLYDALDRWIGARPALPGLRLTATGPLRLFVAVDRDVAGGLVRSFLGAVLVSLAVMAVALRSLRLGLVALVPNTLPLVLVLALLGLAGIPLQAATTLVFSVALVVADDDTIQLLARFRRHHAGLSACPEPARHRKAILRALREAGPPMVLTAVAVSLAFTLLLMSSLVTTARVGYLLAGVLLGAVAGDLFLTPLLVVRALPLAARDTPRRLPR